MTLAPLALAAALAAAPAPPSAPAPAPAAAAAPRVIQVTGEGHAFATPDVARVTAGVESRDASLAKATADANARMAKVLAAIEKAGVARKDVRTVRYDVAVQHDARKGDGVAISGYVISNRVEVTVRELAKLGTLLDQMAAAGANAVDGVALGKEDASAERSRALDGAVADARGKAAVLAKAAGVALGDVLLLSEIAAPPMPMRGGFMAARASSEVPVAEGQLEFVSSVDATFAIR